MHTVAGLLPTWMMRCCRSRMYCSNVLLLARCCATPVAPTAAATGWRRRLPMLPLLLLLPLGCRPLPAFLTWHAEIRGLLAGPVGATAGRKQWTCALAVLIAAGAKCDGLRHAAGQRNCERKAHPLGDIKLPSSASVSGVIRALQSSRSLAAPTPHCISPLGPDQQQRHALQSSDSFRNSPPSLHPRPRPSR